MADTTETETSNKVAEDEVKDVDKESQVKKEEVSEAVSGDKDPKDDTNEEEEAAVEPAVEVEVEDIYDEELPDRIIVGRNHPLSFYVDRARRVFRMEEEVYITGRGDNISNACKLVETLKRQKIATITKISTGMNVVPYFNSYGEAKWSQPTAVILFTLKRGELGKFIADYQQRKIIEIFEKNDEKQSGELSLDKVTSLQLDKKFKANNKQIEDAKQFLNECCTIF
eukprot:125260_1